MRHRITLTPILLACACSAGGVGGGGGRTPTAAPSTAADAGPPAADAGAPASDAGRPDAGAPAATPATEERCGDGLDQDLDGLVDEGCACEEGATQPCFAGDPRLAGVGACVLGEQACDFELEFGAFGECVGSGAPSAETCDDVDQDCDGLVDEGTDPGDACGVCGDGTMRCVDGEIRCVGASDPTEICDDGVDDDCDGLVDEGCACFGAGTTPWQQWLDPTIHCFGRSLDRNPREFDWARIPAEGAAVWGGRSVTDIDFDTDSTIPDRFCDGPFTGAVYTYFQTFIDVPAGARRVELSFGRLDDAVAVRVFNARCPGGCTDGSWIAFDRGARWDLTSAFEPGRNRLVLVHLDDNPRGRALSDVELEVDGLPVDRCR